VCEKLPSQKTSTLLPGNGARKEAAGAELTGENIVDVGVLFPGNGARKEAAGV
jgi:hypothetical protein